MQKIPSYFPLKCVSSVKEEKAHKASYTNGFKELADAKSKNVYPLFLQKTGPRDAMPEALREWDSLPERQLPVFKCVQL